MDGHEMDYLDEPLTDQEQEILDRTWNDLAPKVSKKKGKRKCSNCQKKTNDWVVLQVPYRKHPDLMPEHYVVCTVCKSLEMHRHSIGPNNVFTTLEEAQISSYQMASKAWKE